MKRQLGFLIIMCKLLVCKLAYNQTSSFQQVVPLSPNSASFAKYLETPVGSFTGVAPISVPIFNIQAGSIKIPLTINYHSGGNRVESIASWVGLGWSLNGIPSISRQIRGLSDESTGGFFSAAITIKELYENRGQAYSNFYNKLIDVKQGLLDTESDIYAYTLLSGSGKFVYDQEKKNFKTLPHNNIKIERGSVGTFTFRLTDEMGIIYIFDQHENTITQGNTVNPTPPQIVTWYPSMIISPTSRDTVFFNYTTENQIFRTRTSSTQLVPLHISNGLFNAVSVTQQNLDNRPLLNTTYTTALLPLQISYRGGSVLFEKSTQERLDLLGGYSLKKIVLKDYRNIEINQFNFRYNYISGSSSDAATSLATTQETKYMFLDSLFETIGGKDFPYCFKYDLLTVPGSRISFAQDEWGYYNGKVLNNTLLSSQFIARHSLEYSNPLPINAADRNVDINFNQFGIIKEIKFPTKGKVEYEFETNIANDPMSGSFAKHYKNELASIEVADGETTSWPSFASYQTEFVINNPPESFLNNNFVNGGALIDIEAGYFGCDLTNGSSPCAQIAISSISTPGTPIYMPIYANQSNNTAIFSRVFLPNGQFKIQAVFDQPTPAYENFFITVRWKSLDSSYDNTSGYVGGLRIKKINQFDLASSEQPVSQIHYKYTTDFFSSSTSGNIFSENRPIYSKVVNTEIGDYLKIESFPTIQTILESGSCIGYDKVFMARYTTDASKAMVTEMNFINHVDEVSNRLPYETVQNSSFLRGKPHKEVAYTYTGSMLIPVHEKQYNYEYLDTSLYRPFSLKVDFYDLSTTLNTNEYFYLPFETPPIAVPSSPFNTCYIGSYEHPSYSFLLKSVTEKQYNTNTVPLSLNSYTEFTYSPITQYVIKEKKSLSNGNYEIREYFRVEEKKEEEIVYNNMLLQNRMQEIVQTKEYYNTNLNKTITGKYADYNGLILQSVLDIQQMGGPDESRLLFEKYDENGNILERKLNNNINEVYLWGYKNSYPVAKIIGGDYTSVSMLIDQNLLNNGTSSEIDAQLLALRNTFATNPLIQVFTYTYKPLVGITTETDPNGRTIYYEYDSFNRLYLIKDNDSRILKQICYNYAGQGEDCGVETNTVPLWQSTGLTRCQPCPANNSYTSNVQEHQEKDNNPNSPTYNTYRWISDGVNNNCTPQADWQNTATSIRCKKNGSNENTGEQEREQRDINPCSSTYNQLRWIITGTNLTSCPLPATCNTSNCSDEGFKCINGNCEYGVRICINSYYDPGSGLYTNTYRYEWSDGTWSSNHTELTEEACAILE